ncbi:MAG: S-adenosylmethionine:tRNA ribosyltransferase-isomerase, partial [Verrucomicrobia bacterium]|nr:S-adenosylmethionine:tRNA ribosyltransferase-isomerase [Verrucomicrobiota bacterium]
KTEILTDHLIHEEEFEISSEAAENINSSERVLAVGTTVVRTLETMANHKGKITPGYGSTKLFIYPGFTFRRTNILLTNFHLPKSTLLALVAAFAGRDLIMEAYSQAVKERYRFFSYGDCMLVL